MKRCVLAAIAVFALLAGARSGARADIDGDELSYEQWGWRVSMTGPKNWVLSEDRSYPSVKLWMTRRDPPGQMLLTSERKRATAIAYAKETAALLLQLGFTVRQPQLHSQTGAYWIDFDNGEVYLRQAFLVVGDVGYALTLKAADSRQRGHHLRAFDAALRSLRIKRIPLPEPASADAGAP